MKELATALVKAQKGLHNLGKDAQGYGYKYLTLGKLIEETRGPLAECGLVVVQTAEIVDGQPAIKTILLHESGESIEGLYPITPVHVVGRDGENKTNDAQGMGSAITYARRYCLAAILNIAQEDDDGTGELVVAVRQSNCKPNIKRHQDDQQQPQQHPQKPQQKQAQILNRAETVDPNKARAKQLIQDKMDVLNDAQIQWVLDMENIGNYQIIIETLKEV